MTKRRSLAVLLCVLVAGCTTRDAANPLDPDNPDTHGKPAWLSALADDGAVDVAWDVPGYDDLREVRLVDADTETVLARTSTGEGTFRHAGLANGEERRYRLDLVLETARVLDLPVVIAEPGPEVVWVFEDGSGILTRLTPDGRSRRSRTGYPSGNAVFADPDSGFALLSEFYAGRVRLIDRDGVERWSNDSLLGPLVALRVFEGWWVADARAGAVHFVDDAGGIVWSDSSFVQIIDLAAAGENAVWVADRDGVVARLERNVGVTRRDSTAAEPVAVSAAPDGGFWVADRAGEALVRISAAGDILARIDDRPGVVALYPDPVVAGSVWAVDRVRRSVALFDPDGSALAEITGLTAPSSMAVSPDGGTLWIADPGLGRVIRMRRDGTELSRSEPLAFPTSIAVAFAPGRPRP